MLLPLFAFRRHESVQRRMTLFNVQAVVLKMLLASEQKQIALETFSKLHKDHFNDAFSSIYQAVQNYYKKYNAMPSIDALMLEANRNARLS
ncbi:hypothetical protein FG708_23710, partial [Salmonella enterica subsp. enterica serovar Anatum]